MANSIRIKKRSAAGAAGAPVALRSSELAFNEADLSLYYGFGDDGSANATSIIAIGGPGAFVGLGGDQTITGNKTFTGDVDLTSANVTVPTQNTADSSNAAASTAFVKNAITNAGGYVDPLTTKGDLLTHNGTSTTRFGIGTSGQVLAVGATGEIEWSSNTADSAEVVSLRTLSGTSAGDDDFGTFAPAGAYQLYTANSTTKALFIETQAELGRLDAKITVNEGAIATIQSNQAGIAGDILALETDVSEIRQAIGIADGDTDLGAFAGEVITDGSTVKEALEELEAAIENGSGSVTGDTGSANFANGTVNALGGTGITTTGDNVNTLTISLDDTTVAAGSYGDASNVPQFQVDAQGRLTSAGQTAISITESQISDLGNYLDLDNSGDQTVAGNIIVEGDLTVNGEVSTINVIDVEVEDKTIILGATETPTDATASGGGMILKGTTDKSWLWQSATAAWTSSENVDIASGKSYMMNGTNVLTYDGGTRILDNLEIDGGTF